MFKMFSLASKNTQTSHKQEPIADPDGSAKVALDVRKSGET